MLKSELGCASHTAACGTCLGWRCMPETDQAPKTASSGSKVLGLVRMGKSCPLHLVARILHCSHQLQSFTSCLYARHQSQNAHFECSDSGARRERKDAGGAFKCVPTHATHRLALFVLLTAIEVPYHQPRMTFRCATATLFPLLSILKINFPSLASTCRISG